VGLIQSWEGVDTVVIVDAVRSLAPPGTLHHFGADQLTGVVADGVQLGGGHLLGLGEAIDLARALDRLPRVLEVLGIEGENFELGEGLGESVARAVDLAVEHVCMRITDLLVV
jgi:hydrogenase maturation protease